MTRSARPLLAALAAAAALLPAAAHAAIDFSDYYQPLFHEDQAERIPGPAAGDYAGLPINAAARERGDTWNASLITMPERQCIPHPAPYEARSVNFLRLWENRDPGTLDLISIESQQGAFTQRRTIWMDGRPHPPEWVIHSWAGFSTGEFQGDTLVVRTTHMKQSFIRRNGLPMSDKAELTERYVRHGNVLQITTITVDPVYLTEPLVKTTNYIVAPQPNVRAYPCRPAVEIPRPPGTVPHNERGDHSASIEYANMYHLPLNGVRGGAETSLPDFADKIPPAPPAPRRPDAQ